MKKVLIQYKMQAENVAEVERLIAAVFVELSVVAPQGIRYSVQKMEDGLRFIHTYVADANVKNPVVDLVSFHALQQFIREGHSEKPVSVEVSDIGLYDSLS